MVDKAKADGLRKVPRRGTRELLKRAVDALLRDVAEGTVTAADGATVIEAVTRLVTSGAFYLSPGPEIMKAREPKRAYTLEALEKAALDVLHEFGARSEGWGCPSLRNLQTVLADAPGGAEPVLERGAFVAVGLGEHVELVGCWERGVEATKEIARFKLIEEAARRAYLAERGSQEERLALGTIGVLLGLRESAAPMVKVVAGGGPGDAPEREVGSIVETPGVLGGKPRLHGTLIGVSVVLAFLAYGWDAKKVLEQYPSLETADVEACVAWEKVHPGEASVLVDEETEASMREALGLDPLLEPVRERTTVGTGDY